MARLAALQVIWLGTDRTLAHITGVWISWSGVKWLLRTCLATGQRIYFG